MKQKNQNDDLTNRLFAIFAIPVIGTFLLFAIIGAIFGGLVGLLIGWTLGGIWFWIVGAIVGFVFGLIYTYTSLRGN